jgi:hypothetical protein
MAVLFMGYLYYICYTLSTVARSTALLAEKHVGVAHHQVDVFLMEPGSNRCLGRLCKFAVYPKGREVASCSDAGRLRTDTPPVDPEVVGEHMRNCARNAGRDDSVPAHIPGDGRGTDEGRRGACRFLMARVGGLC